MNRSAAKRLSAICFTASLLLAGCSRQSRHSSMQSLSSIMPASDSLQNSLPDDSSQISKDHSSAQLSSVSESVLTDSVARSEETQQPEGIALGHFDSVPVAVFEQGWALKRYGNRGFLKPDGTWAIEPDNYSVMMMCDPGKQPDPSPSVMEPVQFAKPDQSQSWSIYKDRIVQQEPGGIGGTANQCFVLDDDGSVRLLTKSTGQTSDLSAAQSENILPAASNIIFRKSDFLSSFNSGTGQPLDYYIWSPQADQVVGPYTQDDRRPCIMQSSSDHFDIIPSTYLTTSYTLGPFLYQEPDGSYTVYSYDGTKKLSGYDDAAPAGVGTMCIRKGNDVEILDCNLNVVWQTKGDLASAPVSGKILVCEDDIWYLR